MTPPADSARLPPPATQYWPLLVGLFVERGYTDTSMADIAAAARVSPRTVFGGFGSKAQLLKQVLDAAIVGDAEPVPLHQRPWMRRFHDSTTFAEACTNLATVFAAVDPRAVAIYNVVHRAADSDPQIAALERDLDQQRLTGVGYMADSFARLLGVTDPAAVRQIRDTLWVLGAPLQYGLLVHDRGSDRSPGTRPGSNTPCGGCCPPRPRTRSELDPGVGVQAGDEQVDADEVEPERGQPDHRDHRRPPAPPAGGGAGVQVSGVDHPGDQGPGLLGVPAPVAAPGVLGPDRAGGDGEGPQREGEGEEPVRQHVEPPRARHQPR